MKAEAENLGKSESAHVRDIVAAHFEGTSVEQVREQLGDLAAEVSKLTASSSARSVDAEQVRLIAQELGVLRVGLQELSAAVHHVFNTVLAQLGASPVDARECLDQFEQLRAQYRGKEG